MSVSLPMDLTYHHSAGEHFSYFFKKLKEKEIYGTQCPSCRSVYLPPRPYCGDCHVRTQGWVRVGPHGTIRAVSEIFLPILDPGTGEKRKVPHTMVLVQLDGTDSLLHHVVLDEQKQTMACEIGARVEIVFGETSVGRMTDIVGFRLCYEMSDDDIFDDDIFDDDISNEQKRETVQALEPFPLLTSTERVRIPFAYTAGKVAADFFERLKSGELAAMKCKDCQAVNLPPSRYCYQCQSTNQEWVPISLVGKVEGLCFLNENHRKHLPKDVFGWGLVRFEGVQSGFVHHVVDPELKVGDSARLTFRENRVGRLLDIRGFQRSRQ